MGGSLTFGANERLAALLQRGFSIPVVEAIGIGKK